MDLSWLMVVSYCGDIILPSSLYADVDPPWRSSNLERSRKSICMTAHLMEIQIHSIEPPVSVAGARSLINPTRPRWVNKTNATYLFYIGFPAFDENWQLSGDRQRHLTTYPSIYPQSVLRLWWCGCSLCCCHVHVSSWIGWCVQLWKELLTQPSIIGCGYTGTEFILPNRPHEISVGSQLVAGAQKTKMIERSWIGRCSCVSRHRLADDGVCQDLLR